MNTMKGARVPIERKGHNFIVEIKVQNEETKEEGGYMVPKKVAKRWDTGKHMDVDEGRVNMKNRYGAPSVIEEDSSVFAGQGWGMYAVTIL